MNLTYEAVDATGTRRSARLEAPNVHSAVEQLRRDGLYVTDIRETPCGDVDVPHTATGVRVGRLPFKTLVLFARQMAMLLRAGSGVVPALMAIKRQLPKPERAAVLDQLIHDLEDGLTLTEALRKQPQSFDCVFCSIIAAGEASATLADMFERLAVILQKRNGVRKKIIGAIAYPGLLIVMSFHIMGVLLFFVLPRFGAMFEQLGIDPPASTKFLLAVAMTLRTYWPLFIVAALACGVGAGLLFFGRRGRRWLGDRLIGVPLVGRVLSQLIQGQLLRTMGVLIEARVGLLETLELSRGVTENVRFSHLFDQLDETVTAGGSIYTVFERSPLIAPHVSQAIRTGEESGNLGGAISYCADALDETNEELVNAAARLLEPLILIGMGFVVGLVAVSLFMPLFDMTAAMQ